MAGYAGIVEKHEANPVVTFSNSSLIRMLAIAGDQIAKIRYDVIMMH